MKRKEEKRRENTLNKINYLTQKYTSLKNKISGSHTMYISENYNCGEILGLNDCEKRLKDKIQEKSVTKLAEKYKIQSSIIKIGLISLKDSIDVNSDQGLIVSYNGNVEVKVQSVRNPYTDEISSLNSLLGEKPLQTDSVELGYSEEFKLGYSIGSSFGGRMAMDFKNLDLEAYKAGFKAAYTGVESKMTQEEIVGTIQAFQQNGQITNLFKLSYSIGTMFGGRMSSDFQNLDLDAFEAGIEDAYTGVVSKMTQEEMDGTIEAFQKNQMEKMQYDQAETTKQASEDWLAEKAREYGVKKAKSGLMYKVITQRYGAKPAKEDTVKVHYEGKLFDGTKIDSSYERGEPISFPLNQVIEGWTEGLQLMSMGSKYELYIPSELAYGSGGTGPIPPHAALQFTIELLDIE